MASDDKSKALERKLDEALEEIRLLREQLTSRPPVIVIPCPTMPFTAPMPMQPVWYRYDLTFPPPLQPPYFITCGAAS